MNSRIEKSPGKASAQPLILAPLMNQFLSKKTIIVTASALLIIGLAVIFVKAFNIVLLAFGGLLLALLFHGIASRIEQWTKLKKRGLTLAMALIIVVLFFAGMSWLVGTSLTSQIEEFQDILPETIENVKNYINQTEIGRDILENTNMQNALGEDPQQILSNVQGVFKSTFGVIGDIYIVLFFAAFFMVTPSEYVRGVAFLFPKKAEIKAKAIISRLGADLTTWLKAQLFEMLFIFVTTAIGLLIIGESLWLVLAVIAGLLTFIPNIGPVLAIIPAILVGLLSGIDRALIIGGLYLFVQFVESAIVGPIVRKKLLSLPPALVLLFQLIMGTLSGIWGILLATPLLVVLMILVRELYVKDTLGKVPLSKLRK
ncbi:MAG: AI-2E family transporter [Bacteroidia bacterium]|nr:AI-2E family transporter [Bacteroidia bacterium]